MDRDDPSYKGQAGYNRFLLAIYDPFVLGFMARVVWRCPIPSVVERYRQHLGRRHLDVGPGTGYFIEKAAPPAGTEITLLDPNPNVLAHSSRRLAAMDPTNVQADVMKPLPVDGRFDSAALNFVLHCLRGPMSSKAVAIRNVAAVLEPDGVLFGGTVLGTAARHTPQARAVLGAFNRTGDFDNLGDTGDGLRQILEESFQDAEVDVIDRWRTSRQPVHARPGRQRKWTRSGRAKIRGRMAGPTDVDEYLAALPEEQRAALEKLRKQIRAAAPDATETISYQMPAFKQDGRFLVSYAAFKDHCSLFPASYAVMETHGDELKPYFSGKGTLRFTPDDPLPVSLVRKIVKARLAENAARRR